MTDPFETEEWYEEELDTSINMGYLDNQATRLQLDYLEN